VEVCTKFAGDFIRWFARKRGTQVGSKVQTICFIYFRLANLGPVLPGVKSFLTKQYQNILCFTKFFLALPAYFLEVGVPWCQGVGSAGSYLC